MRKALYLDLQSAFSCAIIPFDMKFLLNIWRAIEEKWKTSEEETK